MTRMTSPADSSQDSFRKTDLCWADETDRIPCDTRVPEGGDGLCARHRALIREPDFDRQRMLQTVFERGPT